MYEKFLCFWLLWLLFIVVVFFMKKNVKRYYFSCWILLVIWLSDQYVMIEEIKFSVSLLVVLLGSIIYFVETAFSMLRFFQAFTVIIGYTSLLLWSKLAPVWFFIPDYVLIPILITLLGLFLYGHRVEGVFAILLFGMTIGHLLFDYLLYSYHLKGMIGEVDYLINISLTVLLLLFNQTVIYFARHISAFLQRKFHINSL